MATSSTVDVGPISIRSKAMASPSECPLSQSRNGSNLLASQDWAPHKKLLQQKYLDEGLTTKEVRRFMLEIHQFSKSIQQYERIFRKWGFKKNLKHNDYEAISRKLIGTSFDKENTEIMAYGRFVPFRALKSRISRHITPTLASRWSQNVTQTRPNESSASFYSSRRSKQDEIVTRQVLAAGRQICYATNLPWFDFLDIFAETYFRTLTPCHVEVDNSIGNIVSFGPKSEAILLDNFNDVDWANQILLTTFWKGLGAGVANDGWIVESQSSTMSPSQLRQMFVQLESQIPRRYPNDYEKSIKTIADGYMPAAAFIALSHLFYLISNQLCDSRIAADCAYLLLRSNAIPWLKSFATSGAPTVKAVLGELVAVACRERNKDLLTSLIRGDNSIDVRTATYLSKAKSTKRPTLLQGIIFDFLADGNFRQHDEEQQKVLHCIDVLLEAGIDLDMCTCGDHRRSTSCGSAHSCWRCSPLQFSMMTSKNSKLVRCLLEHGANVCGCLNITPMIERDADIEIDVLHTLLERGASSRYVRAPSVINCGNIYRYSYWFPLQAALGQRRSDIATLLLAYDAKPNEFSYLEHELTQALLRAGVFVSSTKKNEVICGRPLGYNWLSPLTLSLAYDIRMAEVLLKHDAPVEDCHYQWLAENQDWSFTSQISDHITRQTWLSSKDILEQRQDRFQTALAAAVTSGSLEITKLILARGATIDSPYSRSPLAVAARMGRYDLVKFLLNAGAQVDGLATLHQCRLPAYWDDPDYDSALFTSTHYLDLSPLTEASARDHVEIMTDLINRGANIEHYVGKFGVTPLLAAAICGSYRAVNLLLTHGCVAFSHPKTQFYSVNAFARLQWFELCQLSEDTSDHDKATDGKSITNVSDSKYSYSDMLIDTSRAKTLGPLTIDEILQYKLSSARSPCSAPYSVEIPTVQKFVDVLFLQSLRSKKINLARMLLRQGYTIDFGTSICLLESIKYSHFRLTIDEAYAWFLVLLISQDWSLRPDERLNIAEAMYVKIEEQVHTNGQTKTAHVVSQLKEKAQKILVECLRDCSKQNPRFACILYRALRVKELEMVHWLLDHGVKIDHLPDILVSACYRGYGDIVTQLLISGADVNAEAKACPLKPATPLDAACARGHLNVVKTLLAAGAAIMRETSYCTHSGLVTACSHGHMDVVKELIAHHICINQPAHVWQAYNFSGIDDNTLMVRTPLQAACEEGCLDVVNLLINHDADVNVPAGNYRGVTALQAAAINGHFSIVQRLIGAGARVAASASPKHGRTAIDGAAERGRLDMVKYLLDHYNGDEPMSAVCWRAAGFAKREGYLVVVELLESFPEACANTWQDDYAWSSDSDTRYESESDSGFDSENEHPTDLDTSDIDIFEFVHEDMVL